MPGLAVVMPEAIAHEGILDEMKAKTPLWRKAVRKLLDVLWLSTLAMAVGVAAGTFGAAFRMALEEGEALRIVALGALGSGFWSAVLIVTAVATLAAVAAGMVHRFESAASGSGIPHVEAVLEGALPPAHPARLIPVKFAGGFMAIGGGLALGREGPSVQIGASAANMIARLFRLNWQESRSLMASGAGAGLATAFNAPAAGAVFVLEELVGRFEPRMAILALGASVAAITVSRAIMGDAPDFVVAVLADGGGPALPVFLVFGMLVGLLGVLYNRMLMTTLRIVDALRWPVEARAAFIGACVGAVAVFVPELVGGGDALTQRALGGDIALATIPGLFLLRLVLGSMSYAAATPGGLFAPMLVLGATSGLGFGLSVLPILPDLGVTPEAFAVVGMSALFAATVRAPLTGIILVTEMIDSASLLMPLLVASFGAMAIAEALNEQPIYRALRDRAAQMKR